MVFLILGLKACVSARNVVMRFPPGRAEAGLRRLPGALCPDEVLEYDRREDEFRAQVLSFGYSCRRDQLLRLWLRSAGYVGEQLCRTQGKQSLWGREPVWATCTDRRMPCCWMISVMHLH